MIAKNKWKSICYKVIQKNQLTCKIALNQIKFPYQKTLILKSADINISRILGIQKLSLIWAYL